MLWEDKTLESPLDCKEIQPVHPKGDQFWVFIGRTDAEANSNTLTTWWEELTHWKRPWCWEGMEAGGERDNRGWDGWKASPTQWTWVWVNSRNWWWTGRPSVLQFMGSQSRTWLSDWTDWTDSKTNDRNAEKSTDCNIVKGFVQEIVLDVQLKRWSWFQQMVENRERVI